MYEEQHPIPQDVTAYQFRLVGDMTLKQFFQVAAGVLVALFFYSTNLPVYIKWPFILVSFLFGVALAFFPVEDRPLSKWILLFFMSIYSPTIYVWKKMETKPNYFAPETVAPALPEVVLPQTVPSSTPLTQNMLNQTTEEKKLEKTEEVFLTNVSSQFVNPLPHPVAVSTTHLQQFNIALPHENKGEVIQNTNDRVAPKIPEVETVHVTPKDHSQEISTEQTIYNDQAVVDTSPITIAPSVQKQAPVGVSATYSQEASPPAPPQKPNIVVGQVLSNAGALVEGAILEIVDSTGRSARALRSNRLGHFMIVTPLPSGKYTLSTEKDGLQFDPIQIEAKNQIIPPILIQGK